MDTFAKYFYVKNGIGLVTDFMPDIIELKNLNLSVTFPLYENKDKNLEYGEPIIQATAECYADDFTVGDIDINGFIVQKNPICIEVVQNDLELFFPVETIFGVWVQAYDIPQKTLYFIAEKIKEKQL